MKIADFLEKVHKNNPNDVNSIKIISVEEANIMADDRSKIIQQLQSGDFSEIRYEHAIRKGQTYGIYYQQLVTGRNQNGDRVTLAKFKFPTFDLETEDGSIAIRQGKIS